MFWTCLLGYMAMVALAARLARRRMPQAPRARVATSVSAPGPCLVAIATAAAVVFLIVRPAAPGAVDAGGMAVAVVMVGGTLLAGLAFVVGFLAALAAAGTPAPATS